ncbi:allophanate hydrolase [Jonesia quinghaiensis]|uniref:allophanate hydrolase n=1 Tax=Jonesia quinghaiensis TaxID=262806 RepID=UPI0004038DEF|nr:allophanate hydrolase [Jonesia quinghaiensis]
MTTLTTIPHTHQWGSEGAATQRVEQFLTTVIDNDLISQHPTIWLHMKSTEELLAAAHGVEERLRAGENLPLAGTIFGVKDNIDVAGLPTTAGHPDVHRIAHTSASVVTRLENAGAIVVGKTNLDQFATGLTGARSGFGPVRSAVFPDRISGGSSSGSAAAVGHAMVDFALGTDTAGSGRIPAAFNNIVGIKPTLGLVAKDHVIPACVSFDAVTVLAPTLTTATQVLSHMIGTNLNDPTGRTWPTTTRLTAPKNPHIAVPDDATLGALSPETRALFTNATNHLRNTGATITSIDLSEFLTVAKMLYESALVAERAAAFHHHIAHRPQGTVNVVADIADRGAQFSAIEYLHAQDDLTAAKARLTARLASIDALLIPTAPRHPTLEETLNNPAAVNTEMGTFTNFMNLLDLAGVAVPWGTTHEGAFGVTVVTKPFDDQVGIDIAAQLTGDTPPTLTQPATRIVVFGAHRTGQPLHHQLTNLGARYHGTVTTSAGYRMLALPAHNGLPARPAIIPATDGTNITGEEWLITPTALGTLATQIAAPLALGHITLNTGRSVLGFTAAGTPTGLDITHHKDWVAYLTSNNNTLAV